MSRYDATRAMRRAKRILPSVLLGIVLAACGGDKDKDAGGMAKAFDNTSDAKKAKEAAANFKNMKEKADKEAEEVREKELEKLTTPPTPLPADIETACGDAGKALDEYAQKRLADDQTALGRWNTTKEPDMRKLTESCTATAKIEVGACIANALRNAPPGMFGAEASSELIERCNTRWGGADLAAAKPPQ